MMKTFIKYILALGIGGALALTGCKKDKDDSKPSFSGKLKMTSLPAYVLKGDVYHIVASGLYRGSDPADSLVGYRMYDPVTSTYDTLRAEGAEGVAEGDFVVRKDSLATFSLSVYAYASGYYGSSATSSFTIVNPSLDTLEGSLTRHPFGYEQTSHFQDSRDSRIYYATSLSTGGWMTQNLAWDEAGIPFADSEAMNYIAGRFYNWDEAQTACPAGWKLPSDTDFAALAGGGTAGETITGAAAALKGDVWFNGSQMWPYQDSSIQVSNDSGFTALPWGYLTVSAGVHLFRESGVSAIFWTSDSVDSDTALARYIKLSSNDFYSQPMDKKSFYASVRCIKE